MRRLVVIKRLLVKHQQLLLLGGQLLRRVVALPRHSLVLIRSQILPRTVAAGAADALWARDLAEAVLLALLLAKLLALLLALLFALFFAQLLAQLLAYLLALLANLLAPVRGAGPNGPRLVMCIWICFPVCRNRVQQVIELLLRGQLLLEKLHGPTDLVLRVIHLVEEQL